MSWDPFSSAIIASRRLSVEYRNDNGGRFEYPIPLVKLLAGGKEYDRQSPCLMNTASRLMAAPVHFRNIPKSLRQANENNVAAMLWREANQSTVFVTQHRNTCWRRLFIAKELCHLMQGKSHQQTMSVDPKEVVNLLVDLVSDAEPTSDLHRAEKNAYYGAIEMLLPMELQDSIAKDFDSGVSNLQIAQKYRVPESVVEYRYGRGKERFNAIYEMFDYKAVQTLPVAHLFNR